MIICNNCGMHGCLEALQWCILGGESTTKDINPDPHAHWCNNCKTHPEFVEVEHPIYIQGSCSFQAGTNQPEKLKKLLPIKNFRLWEKEKAYGKLTHTPSVERLLSFIPASFFKIQSHAN